MNNKNENPDCQSATPYHYDYLCGLTDEIPADIANHIASCPDCLKEVEWLKQAEAESETPSKLTLEVASQTAQMRLHCDLIDKPVRCSTIKPFLPTLAIPEMAVQIKTPVTGHINACEQCAADLNTLKNLDLSPEQLCLISQVFTGKSVPVTDEALSLPEIQKITKRPDSGVVTCFQCNEKSDVQTGKPTFTCVKVSREDPSEPNIAPVSIPPKSTSRTRWILKPLAAAAAIIIVAVMLFRPSSVVATDIGQIYEALKDIQNIVMTQYETGNPEPIQTIRISKSSNMKLIETGEVLTLYDLNNKIQKIKVGSTSQIQSMDLSSEEFQIVNKSMDAPWGLMPFKNKESLPEGAIWKQVLPDDLDESVTEQIEVYDLFWTRKISSGKLLEHQWRFNIDFTTKRPLEIQLWTREPQQTEYESAITFDIGYPTQEQMQQVIKKADF